MKMPYCVLPPKVVFYNILPYFPDGANSRPGRLWIKLYSIHAEADKSH